MRAGIEAVQQVVLCHLVDDHIGLHLGDFCRDFQSGFGHLVFLLEVFLHVLHIVQEMRNAVVRYEGVY